MGKYAAAIKKLEHAVITCLCCKGNKKQKVTVDERMVPKAERDNPSGISFFEMNCYWCSGTGVMNKDQQWSYNYEQQMWCKCDPKTRLKENRSSYYVDDNVHKVVRKHHWRCSECHKVTQVG